MRSSDSNALARSSTTNLPPRHASRSRVSGASANMQRNCFLNMHQFEVIEPPHTFGSDYTTIILAIQLLQCSPIISLLPCLQCSQPLPCQHHPHQGPVL